MASAREVVFTVLDGRRLLDLTGPLDTFALANDLHAAKGPAPYSLRAVSVTGGPVRTSSDLFVSTEPLSALQGAAIDTLIVGGGAAALRGDCSPQAVRRWLDSQADLVEWITHCCVNSRRLCSVCTGTFLLAATGILSGRSVATHWAAAQLLANCFPALRAEPDLIFRHDEAIWTSGGVTAGVDLALALIDGGLGGDHARQIARALVMFVTRQGGQSQYTAPFAAQLWDRGDFAKLHAWMAEHIAQHLGIEDAGSTLRDEPAHLHADLRGSNRSHAGEDHRSAAHGRRCPFQTITARLNRQYSGDDRIPQR